MIAVCVTFAIKPGRMEDFMVAMKKQARDSLEKEVACRHFDICGDGEATDEVFLYELYDDRGAFQVHLESDHFQSFDAKVADMVAGKEVKIFDQVISG